MDGVKIDRLEPVDPKDWRGPTREWKFPDGHQITVFERKKGTKFGMHYHKGEDPSKNPERFYLVRGCMKATFTSRNSEEREEHVVEAGQMFEIHPNVYHAMEAIEDCVFIEYRVTHFDREKPDTYSV
mgnify:CR=1 FL=1